METFQLLVIRSAFPSNNAFLSPFSNKTKKSCSHYHFFFSKSNLKSFYSRPQQQTHSHNLWSLQRQHCCCVWGLPGKCQTTSWITASFWPIIHETELRSNKQNSCCSLSAFVLENFPTELLGQKKRGLIHFFSFLCLLSSLLKLNGFLPQRLIAAFSVTVVSESHCFRNISRYLNCGFFKEVEATNIWPAVEYCSGLLIKWKIRSVGPGTWSQRLVLEKSRAKLSQFLTRYKPDLIIMVM